jgi:hypothetical protein
MPTREAFREEITLRDIPVKSALSNFELMESIDGTDFGHPGTEACVRVLEDTGLEGPVVVSSEAWMEGSGGRANKLIRYCVCRWFNGIGVWYLCGISVLVICGPRIKIVH